VALLLAGSLWRATRRSVWTLRVRLEVRRVGPGYPACRCLSPWSWSSTTTRRFGACSCERSRPRVSRQRPLL